MECNTSADNDTLVNKETPVVIISKNGLEFSRMKKNNYTTAFSMVNNRILLPPIFNFDIINLIYKINPDIYEYVKLTPINENEAELVTVTKHFFKDLGMPQRYVHLKIIKTNYGNVVEFRATSIIDNGIKPENVPAHAAQLPIVLMKTVCTILSPHHVAFTQNMQLNDKAIPVPPYVEKILGSIMTKIFTRVKQFIENVTV
jgi:hypothetical protein